MTPLAIRPICLDALLIECFGNLTLSFNRGVLIRISRRQYWSHNHDNIAGAKTSDTSTSSRNHQLQ